MLAADYSQLELRMIAHLSQDSKLIKILNGDGDVFKLITAQWKSISVEEVTPEQRQQAKQVSSEVKIVGHGSSRRGHIRVRILVRGYKLVGSIADTSELLDFLVQYLFTKEVISMNCFKSCPYSV